MSWTRLQGDELMIAVTSRETDAEAAMRNPNQERRATEDVDEVAAAAASNSGNGLASGLQRGGIAPGGSPGAIVGSIGTGGGSTASVATGEAARSKIDEEH
jgi:hypothetical protein